jgi:DNA-binding NarL/FixJ family response regulator
VWQLTTFESPFAKDAGRETEPLSALALSVVLGGARPSATARIRTALEDDGFVVVGEARNVSEAVQAAVRLRPDVCLLDLALAGDWPAAIDEIRASAPDTKIAVLAASVSEFELFRTIREGADGYVLRGASEDRVASALRALVTGEPATASEPATQAEFSEPPVAAPTRRGVACTVLYGPRFVRHFYHRIQSRMPFAAAWESTRERMLDYD